MGDSGPTTRRACGSAPGYEGEQKHCLGLIKYIVWRETGMSKLTAARRANRHGPCPGSS